VLINRLVVHPKHVLLCNLVNDQFLDRSYVIFPGSCGLTFPGSHAAKLHDIIEAEGSHDGSRIGSCDRFPWSHGLWVTWL